MSGFKHIAGAIFAIVFVVLVGIPVVFGSWYTVDQKERAVITQNGAVVDNAGPGLHWKTPWIQTVHTFQVTTDKLAYDHITGHTSDQQEIIDLSASVNYHIDSTQVEALYGQLGDKYESVKLAPVFLYEVGTQLGKFSAKELINKRDEASQAVADSLRAQMAPYHIIIETVQIQQPKFNQAFDDNIKALIAQEVAVRTQGQALEREKIDADIAITKAYGASESAKKAADGEAYATLTNAASEAKAIQLKGDALAHNPGLVEMTKAERWNGVMPTIVMGGGAMPMINLGKTGQ